MLSIKEVALTAKEASKKLALTSSEERNEALAAMARVLRDKGSEVVEANQIDMKHAREAGMSEGLLDRLLLDDARVMSMADALESLMSLPDPIGIVHEQRRLANGMELRKVSVPLGVVAVVYEARPNVTADAAGICLKAGNSVVLRGGSSAVNSNIVIARLLSEAAEKSGMPQGCICAIETTDRSATDELMALRGIIDVLVPRGGAGLIEHCVKNSLVPVIETGTGNCHIYIHESADKEMAYKIVLNAKTRRVGVCNAAETLLVDSSLISSQLPALLEGLSEKGILIHADEEAFRIAEEAGLEHFVIANEHDWETEYLSKEIAVKCVTGLDEAIDHINRYGTKHSEAIVAQDEGVSRRFSKEVDAAAVYVNASTAFTDGGEFGLGAEIGISTQKLHVRGPFALEGLTSHKYVLQGNGQVRA